MPNVINIGPLPIHLYGIILMLGALAAAVLADREAKWRGLNNELVWDGLVWVLIGGIVGARIWHVLTPPPSMVDMGLTTQYYFSHPLAILEIWNGGLGIPGAIMGGALALLLFTRHNHLNFLQWADIAAPAVALGQAIGRWGNFVNQELYGAPTNLPWAIYISPEHRVPGYQNYAYYQPLFLYESIWNLLNMAFLLWLARRFKGRLKMGDLFLIYLIGYPVGRFFLDFIRLDASQVAGIDINQALSAAVAIAAGLLLFLRHRRSAVQASQVGQDQVHQE